MNTLKLRAIFLLVSVFAIGLTIVLSHPDKQNAYGAEKFVRANAQANQVAAAVESRAECPTQFRG